MAVPAAVPLGALALLFFASSSDKANAATPVAPPGGEPPLPPPGPGVPGGGPGGGLGTEVLTPPAVAALTEVRQVDGRPVRYFKATAQQAVVAQLATHGLQPVPSPVAGGAAFRLVPLATGGASAATALTASAQQGLVIAANLAIVTPSASLRFVVVLPRPQIGAIAPSSELAVLLDPGPRTSVELPSPPIATPPIATVPPGSPPGVPPIPAPPTGRPALPGVPPIPPVLPPSLGIPPIFTNVPPGTPPIPGMPPGPGTPGPGDGLDPHLPASLRSEVTTMLADHDIAPEALEQAANTMAGTYPLTAERLRARARELRDGQKLAHIKRGGSPFKVRPGDIPHRLASHYTGDGTRWREIPEANRHLNMHTVSRGGATHLEPWRGEILLPLSWEAWSKPLPPVASGQVLSAVEKQADKALSDAEKHLKPPPSPPAPSKGPLPNA